MNQLNLSREDVKAVERLTSEQLALVRRNLQATEYTDDETREALQEACADGYDVEDFLG